MISDKELIECCLENDRKAQKLLYDKFSSRMLGVCLRYSRNIQEAEDMMSEGFVNIFTKLSSFKADGPFEGWMRKIMVNTSISQYRINLKHQYHQDVTEVNEISDNSENALEKIEARDLMKVIQQMPEGYKVIFNLCIVEGYTHKDVSEITGLSEGTSKSQLSKAKKWLKNKLEEIEEKV